MRVKTFYGWSETGLDRKVNEFLENTSAQIVDIKFSTPILFFSAMVLYKPEDPGKNISF